MSITNTGATEIAVPAIVSKQKLEVRNRKYTGQL